MPIRPLFALLLVAAITATLPATAAEVTKDIVFASPDGHDLKLDLYMPDGAKADGADKPKLVVFIHGGGWRGGNRKGVQTPWIVDEGYALASISYRLTDVACMPAQVHDCKAAIRWLRAHADEYGYNANNIGAVGTSAGGYLVLMLGVTGDMKEMEGDIGGNLDQSSRVQAVVDYYGASDFILRSQNQPEQTEKPNGKVTLLLGGPVQKDLDKARLASPAFQVTPDDPPLLIIHGKKDTTVLFGQSERMANAYESAGLDLTFHPVPEGGHGGKIFFEGEQKTKVLAFLKAKLK